jgi:hypothetical protein
VTYGPVTDNGVWKTRYSDKPDALYDELDTGKKKVKVTLVQALGLCTGRTAHRGSRGIALL